MYITKKKLPPICRNGAAGQPPCGPDAGRRAFLEGTGSQAHASIKESCLSSSSRFQTTATTKHQHKAQHLEAGSLHQSPGFHLRACSACLWALQIGNSKSKRSSQRHQTHRKRMQAYKVRKLRASFTLRTSKSILDFTMTLPLLPLLLSLCLFLSFS